MESAALSKEEIDEIKAESFEIMNHIEDTLNLPVSFLQGEVLDGLFRSFHNLKGIGGFLMQPLFSDVAHAAENVLDPYRSEKKPLEQQAKILLYEALGLAKRILEGSAQERDGQVNTFLQRTISFEAAIKAELEGGGLRHQGAAKDRTPNELIAEIFLNIEETQKILAQKEVVAADYTSILLYLNAIKEISTELSWFDLSSIVTQLANAVELNGFKKNYDKTAFLHGFAESVDYLYGVSFLHKNSLSLKLLKKDEEKYLSFIESYNEDTELKQDEIYKRIQDTSNFSFRVDAASMNDILHLMEDLMEKGSEFEKGDPKNLQIEVPQVFSQIEQLYHRVIKITRVPLKHLFFRFIRVIKNAAELVNKQIEFQMIGEDIEIDRSLLDPLNLSIIHLLRNSCDHGIETQKERVVLGKRPFGLIIIKASIDKQTLKISIKDDGQGLNKNSIKKKLLELGWFKEKDLNLLSDEALYENIFQPGFSTNPFVSKISGRGVGMDVVKKEMIKLGGTVRVVSEAGQGLEIILSIPYNL